MIIIAPVHHVSEYLVVWIPLWQEKEFQGMSQSVDWLGFSS